VGRAFLAEDWVASYETTNPALWGTAWGRETLHCCLPGPAAREAVPGSRYTHNCNSRQKRSGRGGAAAFVHRNGVEFGAFMGIRTSTTRWATMRRPRVVTTMGLGHVPSATTKFCRTSFRRRCLSQEDRNTGGGADAVAQYMVQPMQAELQFAYAAGKNVLEREESNRDEVEDFFSFECGI